MLQSNKFLFSLTFERRLWISVFLRFCRDRGLYVLSYPINTMSVVDIERAIFARSFATRLEAVQDNGEDPISPRRVRSLRTRDDDTFQSFCVAPGGRFVVTETTNCTLQIWDFGYDGYYPILNFPIASLKSNGLDERPTQLVQGEIQITEDGQGLLLLLDSHKSVVINTQR